MTHRRGLTEAEKEIERAKAKRRWHLKQQGKGGMVDAAEMQARIRKLHDVHQITFDRIAEKTGVDLACIKWHYHGRSFRTPDVPLVRCQWAVHNAVMTTPFGPADVSTLIRALGTHRRLQGLVAVGYPQTFLAEATGRSLAALNAFMLKGPERVERVSAEHAASVEQVYRKYIDTDPLSVGVTARSATYSKNVAARRGYLPGAVWDDDTIEDPNAEPEWTGECGTEEGYRIHVRETFFGGQRMPPCARCRAAVETRNPGERKRYPLNREHLAQAIKDSPLTGLQIGEGLYGAENRGGYRGRDVLHRWRDGSRQPRNLYIVEKLAAVLDVDLDYLLDTEVIEAEDKLPAHEVGKFNPFVLRAALDLDGLSFSKSAELPGSTVSKGAVNSWASGTSTPSNPGKVQFLADYFGVDLDVFYS